MRDIFTLLLHAIVTIVRLGQPGGLCFRCCRVFAVGCGLKGLDSAGISSKRVRRRGLKGLTEELIDAVVEMKRRNRTWTANELPSKLLWHSASRSTETWSAGFWQCIYIRRPDRAVRPGFPLSVTLKTRCGRWSFDANRRYYRPIGFWW